MMTPEQDGVTGANALTDEANALRQRLADAAKAYDWNAVLAILVSNQALINNTRPGGQSRYTILHQAAHGGAPTAVVQQLITLGAWRTIRTAEGERAVDIAQRQGHTQLVALLTPVLKRDIAPAIMAALQVHFHAVIQGRIAEFNITHQLHLPEIEPLLELDERPDWFAVPGMYGGFSYWLSAVADDPVLLAESWCRVIGGSGQRHLISAYGSVLIAEGFV